MNLRCTPRLLVALVFLLGCSDATAPTAPGFRLVSVDANPLPALHEIVSTFEHGTVFTSVLASRITFNPDSTFLTQVTLRDSSAQDGRSAPYVVNSTGRYVIASDSLTICTFCGDGGGSAFFWKVAYQSSGFTLPLLFSTGPMRAYRYEWR